MPVRFHAGPGLWAQLATAGCGAGVQSAKQCHNDDKRSFVTMSGVRFRLENDSGPSLPGNSPCPIARKPTII